MFIDMENWAEIRRRVLVDGQSKRSVCREFDIHWDTAHRRSSIISEPPGYRRAAAQPQAQARTLPPGRHPTDPRGRQEGPQGSSGTPPAAIFERLRDEYGYTGGLTIVKAEPSPPGGLRSAEVFIPLAHPPGARPRSISARPRSHLDGKPAKVALFVMTLPYSDALFVVAFPRECTEAFLEGHLRAFEFFAGVPRRISYDNLQDRRRQDPRRVAHRKVTDAFLQD